MDWSRLKGKIGQLDQPLKSNQQQKKQNFMHQSKSDAFVDLHTKTQEENSSETKKACGLCGKTKKLTKTRCCDQWICDDSDQYVMFTYAKNSCYRNHHRYTVCCNHFDKEHSGKWQNCHLCHLDFSNIPEMYVWYATNNYNFQKLAIPKILMKCNGCNFESYELEDFACSLSSKKDPTEWYCKKERCMQKTGMPLMPGGHFQTMIKPDFFA